MNLYSFCDQSFTKYPDRHALFVENQHYTYREFEGAIGKISNKLFHSSGQNIGIFAARSLSAYAGVMATLKAGKTYVPLNPKFPVSRNLQIATLADLQTLIVDQRSIASLQDLNESIDRKLTLLFPEIPLSEIPSDLSKNHKVFAKGDIQTFSDKIVDVDKSTIAYILFTSGSTGFRRECR